jgi:cell division protein FtsQ
MAFSKAKNRRRQDSAHRKAEVSGALKRLGAALVRVVAAIAIGAAFVFGGFQAWRWALTSQTFELKTITIHGAARAQASDLLKLGGLARGQNLFRLRPLEIEQGMAAHPWVRHVSVTRHLPSSVVVEIEEHVPAALASLGELYVLDEQGVPFKKLEPPDAIDLPIVTGVTREGYLHDPAAVGAKLRSALETMRAYDALASGKADQPFDAAQDRLSEVHLDEAGVALVSASGQVVRMGSGDLAGSLARLLRVRHELSARGLAADVIHLENRARPGWVAVKLSTSASERSGGRK